MKLLSLLFCALALTACNPIKGQLKVTRAFSAHSDDNNNNCTPDDPRPICSEPVQPSDFEVAPGTYDASFDLSSRGSATFSIKLDRNVTRNLALTIPSNNHLPGYSGPISLSHDESGQPFDLRGNIDTKESDSAQHSDWESCTRTEYEQQCGPHGCTMVPVQVPGQQWVLFHYHYTDTHLSVQVFKPGVSAAAAGFAGERNLEEKVNDNVGYCQ